ncbi:MAG: dihydroorotate dehydrogenase [Acidobacteria bacterium]|nr:dihydroorotate dehydrogenase [Acidobacteriota bacterium]
MVDLSVEVGPVALSNPIIAASGTAGHGAELDAYMPLCDLGGVVAKSLLCEPWPGNPAPRIHSAGVSMINSVGLQGPGVKRWRETDLPTLSRSRATVIASIWGRSVDDFERAAEDMAGADIVALELNVSCPNTHRGGQMFAHDPDVTAEVVERTAVAGVPRWVKLSPNTDALVDVARAAAQAGAEGLTLVNTLLGMVIDVERRRPTLGGVTGGVSGPALHPVAVRAVYECHKALPDTPIVGVGGVASAADAVELLLAGASAVQVGTATFSDPRAPMRILDELRRWCNAHDVSSVKELIGEAHG